MSMGLWCEQMLLDEELNPEFTVEQLEVSRQQGYRKGTRHGASVGWPFCGWQTFDGSGYACMRPVV